MYPAAMKRHVLTEFLWEVNIFSAKKADLCPFEDCIQPCNCYLVLFQYDYMKDIGDGQAADKKERKKAPGKKAGKKSKVNRLEEDDD